ncbi:MAG: hypothetical protein MJZ05_12915 [Fibrobacter sp.]|nr:hypothetical protein [Fibrobacter sp.]
MLYRKFPTVCQIFFVLFFLCCFGCSSPTISATTDDFTENSQLGNPGTANTVTENGQYTTRDAVGAYICKFNKLPSNYINKSKGQALYEEKTGNTFSKWNFNPWKTLGVMIGGDNFDNREGLLPSGSYHEADVDYGNATSRGTKRLVYQSGCVIYYTADHYETFKKLNF